MKKMGSLVFFSYLLPELWSLNCQKLYPFCNILLMSAKKSESVITIYVYVSESSRFALLENGVGYYAMT